GLRWPPRRRTRRRRPGRSPWPAHRYPLAADSSPLLLFLKPPAQAMHRPEEQQLHRALAATHDHADLLVLEAPLEFEQHRLSLVERQGAHGSVQLIPLLPPKPQPFGIVFAAARDRVGQLDPGRPA